MAMQYDRTFNEIDVDALNAKWQKADAGWAINEGEPVRQVEGEAPAKTWAIEDREGTVLHFGTRDLRSFSDRLQIGLLDTDLQLYAFIVRNYEDIKAANEGSDLNIVTVNNSGDVPVAEIQTGEVSGKVFKVTFVADEEGQLFVHGVTLSGASVQSDYDKYLREARAMV